VLLSFSKLIGTLSKLSFQGANTNSVKQPEKNDSNCTFFIPLNKINYFAKEFARHALPALQKSTSSLDEMCTS
jgi:hypothetical protein